MLDDQYQQLLEDGWQAYQDGRWEDLETLLHEKIVWHEFHDEHEVATGDYEGKAAVMQHFQDCKSAYGNPSDRRCHVFEGDHAVFTDQIAGDPHRCTDLYRIEDNLIREMWTCVTHAAEKAEAESAQA